jgi:hypothetical protein
LIYDVITFDFTAISNEMGEHSFVAITFRDLVSMDSLPEIKRSTNGLEEKYANSLGKRRVNIDPGYICLEHVVLATTKGYAHRPYLREGIYVDLTLIYRSKSFQSLEWTYPDYRQQEVIGLFNQFRKRYADDLKGRS